MDDWRILLITTLAGMLTALGTHVFAIWRESRNRTWLIQDEARREAQRKHELAAIVEQARAEAEALKIKTEAAVETSRLEALAAAERLLTDNRKNISLIREDHRKTADLLVTGFEEVKTMTDQALHASNGAKEELARLNQHLLHTDAAVEQVAAASVTKAEDIHSIAVDHSEKLDTIKNTVERIDDKTSRNGGT